MKIYIVADIEGVSGVSGFDIFGDRFPGEVEKKKRAVELWVKELNAAIEGGLVSGATEILVLDNHGPGDSLFLGSLLSPARLIHGRGRPTWLPFLDESVEALLFVGQHARAGTPTGHLCHTYSRTRLRRVRLNSREIGEIDLVAGIAGARGVPVVFLSGDRRAAEEVRELVPGIGTAVVKEGLSRQACASLSCEQSRALIRREVEIALSRTTRPAPLVFPAPFELVVDYVFKDSWRPLARCLLHPRKGVRWAGWGRLKIADDSLPRLWDRFVGLS